MDRCKVIDIVFPASSPLDDEIVKMKKYIKKLGFEPRIFGEENLVNIKEYMEYPVYSEEFRFNQLYSALKAKDSEIVWVYRGGYGSNDLIHKLRKAHKLPQGNKKLIGYSDITFLVNFLQKEWGWNNLLYAPSCSGACKEDSGICKEAKEEIEDIVLGKQKDINIELEILNKCEFCSQKDSEDFVKEEIAGTIVGGCLCMIIASMGTKNSCEWKDKILFLEDIGECGFRLDRLFKQIVDNIVDYENFPKAIILGNFMAGNTKGAPKEEKIKENIKRFIQRLNDNDIYVPVLYSDKLGHGKYVKPLPIGNECKIIFSENSAVLSAEI